jgi:predicted RNase H-like nuclease
VPEVFVGLDLAWRDKARTGIAAVGTNGALVDSTSVRTDEEIVTWLCRDGWDPVVVAIDAPLIVTNSHGQRRCEREVAQEYGRYGASCHPANLARPWFDPPRAATLAQRQGWDDDPARIGTAQSPVCIEVYPHPAMVALFALDRIIPYKAKSGRSVQFRHAQFIRLIGHMEQLGALALDTSDSWERLTRQVQGATRQVDLDRAEDEIDAILCAYLAWLWHRDRSGMRVFGDALTGYIVIPMTGAR